MISFKEVMMASVEERLAKVEKEIAELKSKASRQSPNPDWLKKVEGTFENNPEFLALAKLGKEFRDAEKLL